MIIDSPSPLSISYGANFEVNGKCDPHKLSHVGAWTPATGSLADLAAHIGNGHPWMPALIDLDQPRQQRYCNFAAVLGVDIDSGLSISAALATPFVQQHCGLLIESASSQLFHETKNPDSHEKFRLVFALAEPLTSYQEIRLCNRFLAEQVGHADPACKDSSRFFFGAPGKAPKLLNEVAKLPADFLNQAQEWEAKQRREWEAQKAQRQSYLTGLDATGKVELARQALEFIPPYTPGNGTYEGLVKMMAGVIHDLGSHGVRLLEAWDAGRGDWGKDFDRMLQGLDKSSGGRSAGLGSMFWLAKQHGFRFPQGDRPVADTRGQGFAAKQIAPDTLTVKNATGTPDATPLELVREAISMGLSGAELKAQQICLAQATRLSLKDLVELWNAVERESDGIESQSVDAAALDKLLSTKSQRLDLRQALPGDMAVLIERRAELLGTTPEAVFTPLLSAIASRIKIGNRLKLSGGSDWWAKPIIWTGLVGEPASTKSPTLKVSSDPILALQCLAHEDYAYHLGEWEKAQVEAAKASAEFTTQKPSKPRLFTSDYTMEALVQVQSGQPERGCLINIDELSGLLDGANQYKGGKGNDRQKMLSLRDGGAASVLRVSKDAVDVAATAFSVSGGIQPGPLKRQMGDFEDSDGFWSRFFWCFLPLLRRQQATPEDEQKAQRLSAGLMQILGHVADFAPQDYQLSPAAARLFYGFQEEMEDVRMEHDKTAIKVVAGKAQGQVGEIALVLHLAYAAYACGQPELFVSEATMAAAIATMRFYISQAELIQNLGAEERGEAPAILAKILDLSVRKGWVKARDCIAANHRGLKGVPACEVRDLLKALAAQGKGELRGENKALEFRAFALDRKDQPAAQPTALPAPTPAPTPAQPKNQTAELQEFSSPARGGARWVPTHKTVTGEPVAIERRYGAGLAAVRNGTGRAFQVPEAELVPLGREVVA
jgi:hypothetical protein